MENLVKFIKLKFKNFENEWLLLFGSQLTEYTTPRSDIDLVFITRIKNKEANTKIFLNNLKYNISPFDFKIFELLPLHIQIEIIKIHHVVFGNALEISEYFYFYRKLWKDQERRNSMNQITSIDEFNIGLKNRKIALNLVSKDK